MTDEDTVGVKATVGLGSPKVEDGLVESIPMNEIMVKTNLEQNVENLEAQRGV